MTGQPAEFFEHDGVRIAYCRRSGLTPGIVWLGGFRSDMRGTKAETLDAWCARRGRAFLRFDYSGHGESSGSFRDGTISRWLGESLTAFDRFTEGPQVLVGSSMGAWIALRMAAELDRKDERERIAGLVLVAPAPDFTEALLEPRLTQLQRRALEEKGYFEEPSAYSEEPDIYTRALIEDGRCNRVLEGIIPLHCPVHVLHGMNDADVPYGHALRLLEHLPASDVTLTLVRDGDHRLSRPQDLEMLIRAVEGIVERH
jgi:pimeloyl-ACP methyl ester carboxylesterase